MYQSAHTNMYVEFVVTNSYILDDLKLRIHTHENVFFAPVYNLVDTNLYLLKTEIDTQNCVL